MHNTDIKSSKCYCINLRRASNTLTEYYDLALKQCGLTLNQYSIMKNIYSIEPCTVSELARLVRLERTTLVRNLKPLIAVGWVLDNVEKGRRGRKLCLSLKGQRLITEATSLWENAQNELKTYLGSTETEELMTLLLKVEKLKYEKGE